MNEEVKIERQLDVFKYTPDEIYDYIYDLKQENNQLAEKVINQRHALCDTNKKIQVLNARIEKAIEYIMQPNIEIREYHSCDMDYIYVGDELLKILKGE